MQPATEAVNDLSNDEQPELTREDLFGMLAGKAKEAAGELVGNDALADEGREQQVEAEAEPTLDADQPKPRAPANANSDTAQP